MNTKTADKKFLAREASADSIEIAEAKETFFYDTQGKKYIDFLMGWCVGNTGWNNHEIKKALQNFDGPEYVYPGLLYKPWVELAEILADITPGKLVKSFRTTGGTESVEAAMQIAMAYTGRGKFISVEGAYHGNSIATLSLGSPPDSMKNHLPNCFHLSPPLDTKAISKLESRLKKKDIAAFIIEPVINSLGVLIPDAIFMQEARALCKKYGTLFVADEVATGFGRTGKLFACEHFQLEPDIMCLAKAISGGYAGLGATITTEKIAKKVEADVSLYSTFGWHPISVHTAIANIHYILENKNELLLNTNEKSQIFRTRLAQMKFKEEYKLNIIGLSVGVDVGSDRYAEKIQKRCLEKGLLIMSSDKHILMFPALNVDTKTVENGLDILESCI